MNSKSFLIRLLVIGSCMLGAFSDKALSATSAADTKNNSENPSENLFDPSRHIDISEITPGMRGYGLTVFSGANIERFDVEVVSILKNLTPKRDAFLIRCLDERFDKAKSVQGVSGSPVFFNGKLAGAMAFGWALTEEPLYGVTPIRQMLEIYRPEADKKQTSANATSGPVHFQRTAYDNLMRPTLLSEKDIQFLVAASPLSNAANGNIKNDDGRLTALPLSIALGGFDPGVIRMMDQFLPGLGLSHYLAGTSGPGAGSTTEAQASTGASVLAPGSTMTIPLITGDMTGAILGTVTEVIGNRIYGFGHPWQNQGPASWPLAGGIIHTFVNRITMSFKLGSATEIIGSIRCDETPGVYGEIGDCPPMIPLRYKIEWPYVNANQMFDVQIARDEQLDPMLATLATLNALSAQNELPQDHTLHYQIEMDFDTIDPLVFEDVSSGVELGHIFESVMGPLGLILNNPWQKVNLERMTVKASISNRDSLCVLKSAQIAQQNYQPGQTVEIRLVFEALRDEDRTVDISLDLPEDLPDGRYMIFAGSSSMHLSQLSRAQPHRFRAYTAEDIQRILQERFSFKRNRVYVCMVLPERGLAIEDQAFPALPAGKAILLNDPSRKTLSSLFKPLISNTVDTDFVADGTTQFSILVQKDLP